MQKGPKKIVLARADIVARLLITMTTSTAARPNFRPFTSNDFLCYEGAEAFAPNAPPLIASLAVDGVTAEVVCDATGVSLMLGREEYSLAGAAALRALALLPAIATRSQLVDLGFIPACRTALPVLVQDEMTIWFPTEKARNAAYCFAAEIVEEARVTTRRSDVNGFGLKVDGSSDAAVDEAVELLMEIATSTPGCTVVDSNP